MLIIWGHRVRNIGILCEKGAGCVLFPWQRHHHSPLPRTSDLIFFSSGALPNILHYKLTWLADRHTCNISRLLLHLISGQNLLSKFRPWVMQWSGEIWHSDTPVTQVWSQTDLTPRGRSWRMPKSTDVLHISLWLIGIWLIVFILTLSGRLM